MRDIHPDNENYISSFSTENLRFVALDKSDQSHAFLSQILDPNFNPNAAYYGDKKHHEEPRIKNKINLWGGRAEKNETARCFVVFNKDAEEALGYVNLGYAGKNIDALEGGALFRPSVSTALQTEALNAVYVQYVEEIYPRSDQDFKPKAANGFIYTLWTNNPLLKAFQDSELKSLRADEPMCQYLAANTINARFIWNGDAFQEKAIKDSHIDIVENPSHDQTPAVRCGFVYRLKQQEQSEVKSQSL